MAQLKKEEWSINVVGKTGMSAIDDVAFGVSEDNKPALRLGENIITGDNSSGSWEDISDKPFNDIAANSGLTKDANNNLGLAVDGATVMINEDGELSADSGVKNWNDIADKPFNTIGGNMDTADGVLSAKPSWDDVQDKPFNTVDTTSGIKIESGSLKLDVVNSAQQYDYRPITSHGVYETLGVVNTLLESI